MPSEFYAWAEFVTSALRQLTIIPSDPALRLAVYSALALAGITLVVMLNVLVLAELASRRERRREVFSRYWRPVLSAWSIEESVELSPLRQRREERLWFLLMWANLQRQLRGSTKQRLNRLFDRLSMDRYVVELLESRRVHRRLLALTCFSHLAEERYWGAVAPLVASPNPVESLAAAQALVAMNPKRGMRVLVPVYVKRKDWARLRFSALCQQAGREAAGPALLNALQQASSPRVAALIAWIEPANAAEWARSILRTLLAKSELESAQREAACAALHCLGELHDRQDREVIEMALSHPLADVRVAALHALKRQSDVEDVAFFTLALGDSNWWVRQAAADALVALPGIDEARLGVLLEGLQDRYGRDALRRAMAEERR